MNDLERIRRLIEYGPEHIAIRPSAYAPTIEFLLEQGGYKRDKTQKDRELLHYRKVKK